jgi:phosphoribosylanthranilate isomerase
MIRKTPAADYSGMKLKICGMKFPDNIREVALLNPDFLGFIFYGKSARYVGEAFDPAVLIDLPPTINKTGVFVNASKEDVLSKVKQYHLDYVQLHGNESVEYCTELRQHVRVIKAFGLHEDFDFRLPDAYEESVELFLFDTYTAEHGGSGKTFNHRLLERYSGSIPFFVSGGLGLEEIKQVAELHKIYPLLTGVDVNSRFEKSPGLKVMDELKKIRFKI